MQILNNGLQVAGGDFEYLWLHLQDDLGAHHYRAIALRELTVLSIDDTEIEDYNIFGRQWSVVRGLYNAHVDFVYTAAGIFTPQHIGVVHLVFHINRMADPAVPVCAHRKGVSLVLHGLHDIADLPVRVCSGIEGMGVSVTGLAHDPRIIGPHSVEPFHTLCPFIEAGGAPFRRHEVLMAAEAVGLVRPWGPRIDLSRVLEAVSESMVALAHESGNRADVVIDPRIPRPLLGDPSQVERCLVHLAAYVTRRSEDGVACLRLGLEKTEQGFAWRFHFDLLL